jgi:hypothetical protein
LEDIIPTLRKETFWIAREYGACVMSTSYVHWMDSSSDDDTDLRVPYSTFIFEEPDTEPEEEPDTEPDTEPDVEPDTEREVIPSYCPALSSDAEERFMMHFYQY